MAEPVVATFSICACDLDAGQWGVATQSKFLAVGSVVPWAEPHVGAIATQSYANPRYGPDGLALLREGLEHERLHHLSRATEDGRDPRVVERPQLGEQQRGALVLGQPRDVGQELLQVVTVLDRRGDARSGRRVFAARTSLSTSTRL